MYNGIIFTGSFVPINPLESRGAVGTGTGVEIILLSCAVAEVLFSIVKAIVVYVVANKMRRGIGKHSMHHDLLLSDSAFCWGITSGITPAGAYLTKPAKL